MADPGCARQVLAAIDAVEILGPTRYAWLRAPFDLPERVRRLAPPTGLRAALVQAVQWRLYADFFTAGKPSPPARRATGTSDGQLARALSAANSGAGAVELGWRFVGADGGRLIVERLGLRLWARPDEVVHEGSGPRAGDLVGVRMAKEAPLFSPGFYMALSDRGLDPDEPRLRDRFYLHVRAESAVRCVELATTRLNAAGLPFRVKVVDDPASFGRCDSAVLTFQRKDRDAALHHVHDLHRSLERGLDATVPALTLRLAPGLGFAEDPGDGVSFGAHRCRLIATALVEAHEAGLTEPDARMELVRAHMARAGTTPEAPYLGPASAREPRLPHDAPPKREEAISCR
jgi:HopA1 effector protein family